MPALIQRRQPDEVKAEATALLNDVGLGARLHHKPGELSGGEQQRVAVARALLQKPDLVLADEPTGNLDTHTGEALFSLLRELNKGRGTTFVIVTHNDKLSSQADRIVHMQDGQIIYPRTAPTCSMAIPLPYMEGAVAAQKADSPQILDGRGVIQ